MLFIALRTKRLRPHVPHTKTPRGGGLVQLKLQGSTDGSIIGYGIGYRTSPMKLMGIVR